jgi:GxxExxY protein
MQTHDDTHGEPVEPADRGRDAGVLLFGHLTDAVIGAGFQVHNSLGAGFLEAVYGNALTVELRRRGVRVERNVPFEIFYRGVSVGRYVADLVVDGKVVVETKAAKAIDPAHRAQLLNYLRASGLEVGLVMNFGSSVQFKRVVATARPVAPPSEGQAGNGKT